MDVLTFLSAGGVVLSHQPVTQLVTKEPLFPWIRAGLGPKKLLPAHDSNTTEWQCRGESKGRHYHVNMIPRFHPVGSLATIVDLL